MQKSSFGGHRFRRHSMCCAQTAAPDGKKNKRREMQKRGHCIIKSIITECSKKTLTNTVLGNPKHYRDAPGSLQNPARAPIGQHVTARSLPRVPERRPRRAQEAPKSAQKASKSAQEPPQRRLGDARIPPKSVSERFRT